MSIPPLNCEVVRELPIAVFHKMLDLHNISPYEDLTKNDLKSFMQLLLLSRTSFFCFKKYAEKELTLHIVHPEGGIIESRDGKMFKYADAEATKMLRLVIPVRLEETRELVQDTGTGVTQWMFDLWNSFLWHTAASGQ